MIKTDLSPKQWNVCVCVCVCVCAHMCAYMSVRVYVVNGLVSMCVWMWVYVCECMCVHVCACVCLCMCVRVLFKTNKVTNKRSRHKYYRISLSPMGPLYDPSKQLHWKGQSLRNLFRNTLRTQTKDYLASRHDVH